MPFFFLSFLPGKGTLDPLLLNANDLSKYCYRSNGWDKLLAAWLTYRASPMLGKLCSLILMVVIPTWHSNSGRAKEKERNGPTSTHKKELKLGFLVYRDFWPPCCNSLLSLSVVYSVSSEKAKQEEVWVWGELTIKDQWKRRRWCQVTRQRRWSFQLGELASSSKNAISLLKDDKEIDPWHLVMTECDSSLSSLSHFAGSAVRSRTPSPFLCE